MRKQISNLFIIFMGIFIFLFISLFQEFNSDFFLFGPRYIAVQDNEIKLSVNRFFNTMELRFLDNANLSDFFDPNNNTNLIIKIRNGTSKTILINCTNQDSVPADTALIKFIFRESKNNSFPPIRRISKVLIDNKIIKTYEFYNNYLYLDKSNVFIYKPFHFQYASHFLANKIGYKLLEFVTIFLLFLLIFQIFLLSFTYIESILIKKNHKEIPKESIFIKTIDNISREHATTLGFLGTILSIWLALEKSSIDYSNFSEILNIIKFAVFTTVLGLLVLSIYSLKVFICKLDNGR